MSRSLKSQVNLSNPAVTPESDMNNGIYPKITPLIMTKKSKDTSRNEELMSNILLVLFVFVLGPRRYSVIDTVQSSQQENNR